MRFIAAPDQHLEILRQFMFCGGMKMSPENKGTPEILTIAPEEFQQMQSAVLDGDGGEALRLIKKFVKRLKEQKNRGLKSHLG